MPKKPKFRPEITRVKLNPEQAVLGCTCYQTMSSLVDAGTTTCRGGDVYTLKGVSVVCLYNIATVAAS